MLNVDLSIRDGDGLAVVALRGELDPADAPAVASHLITAVAVCGPSVIVDLTDLEGIGYSGLAVLLRVRKWTRQNGGDLRLASPQSPVRRLLEATGLIDVFSVHRSVEEAAGSASGVRPRAPEAPVRLRPALVPRCGGRRPVRRPARHVPVRPLRRNPTCRSRRLARDTCARWCSPLASTADPADDGRSGYSRGGRPFAVTVTRPGHYGGKLHYASNCMVKSLSALDLGGSFWPSVNRGSHDSTFFSNGVCRPGNSIRRGIRAGIARLASGDVQQGPGPAG
jgi:anti-anti-sigma factor